MPSHAALPFAPAAVLFDMDGTMIESEAALLECWRQAAQDLGFALQDELWLSMVGLHDRACHDLLSRHLSDTQIQALLDAMQALYDRRVDAGLPLKGGLTALLDRLAAQALPTAVVTSTRRARALYKLERAGLGERFALVVGGDEVVHPKPAPDIYLLAAQRLGVDPARCVVLEDSPAGVRAALGAGMTPIHIPDLVAPSDEVRALGHRIVRSMDDAHALLAPWLRDEAVAR
ncbi:HAD family hydrolase [Lysobacter silvisoli]|uniref:HAD family phosphatase n=1 Tax=Lysobacter silvisoli TaxID=2293254 RepID=A0A371JXF6_9GAMM|nr:HAD family phosphatase [Lysobacter silvisoli]RDZ26287.1 HAD family phosphatase [Lysobacter silvisoli]